MIVIEKGIPMPRTTAGRPAIYLWATMEVGDSFLVSGKSAEGARKSAANAGLRLGRKFSVRKIEGGFRVWRVA